MGIGNTEKIPTEKQGAGIRHTGHSGGKGDEVQSCHLSGKMVSIIIEDCTKRIATFPGVENFGPSHPIKVIPSETQRSSGAPARIGNYRSPGTPFNRTRRRVLLVQTHCSSQLVVYSLSSCLITSELAQSRSIIGDNAPVDEMRECGIFAIGSHHRVVAPRHIH